MSARTTKGLNPAFTQRLEAFLAAAPHPISINSGFRSVARQQQLWDGAIAKYGSEKAARKWVAPPGKSNHNKGVAADLHFTNDAAKKWAHANAGRFGLFFPMDWEDWHIEPIGIHKYDSEAYTEPPPTLETPVERGIRLAQLALGTPGVDAQAPLDLEVNFPMDEFAEMFDTPEFEGDFEVSSAGPGRNRPTLRQAERRGTSDENLARLALQAGFQGQSAIQAIAIALAESGGNSTAVGDTGITNAKWGPSFGLWQVRSLKAENGRGTPRDSAKLLNPLFNAKAAYAISGGGRNFSPWSVFKSGRYNAFLGRAQSALAAVSQTNTTLTTRGSTAGRRAV